jgi:hypothetical protein
MKSFAATQLPFTIHHLLFTHDLPAKVTFEYGARTRFDVDVPDVSLTPPAKP